LHLLDSGLFLCCKQRRQTLGFAALLALFVARLQATRLPTRVPNRASSWPAASFALNAIGLRDQNAAVWPPPAVTQKGDFPTQTDREIATILAAMLFWQEEMCPHDPAVMQPYFEAVGLPAAVPLSSNEIADLSERLRAELSD
jgi:hypothetical protein